MFQVQSPVTAASPPTGEAVVIELDDEQLSLVGGARIPVGGWGSAQMASIPVGGW